MQVLAARKSKYNNILTWFLVCLTLTPNILVCFLNTYIIILICYNIMIFLLVNLPHKIRHILRIDII